MTPTLSADLAEIFESGRPVFLAFSGGKDSLALLRLCEPWRERLTLVWVNTGWMAPHMVEFVRGHGERYRLVELASRDLLAFWRQYGTPADIIPIANVVDAPRRKLTPYLIPWTTCCLEIRTRPLLNYMAAHDGPAVLLYGHHADDDGPNREAFQANYPASVETVAPIWDWTDQDVFAYLAAEGVELPPQYSEVPGSIECVVCPAGGLTVDRMRYIKREFPQVVPLITDAIRRELRAVDVEANRRLDILAEADRAA